MRPQARWGLDPKFSNTLTFAHSGADLIEIFSVGDSFPLSYSRQASSADPRSPDSGIMDRSTPPATTWLSSRRNPGKRREITGNNDSLQELLRDIASLFRLGFLLPGLISPEHRTWIP